MFFIWDTHFRFQQWQWLRCCGGLHSNSSKITSSYWHRFGGVSWVWHNGGQKSPLGWLSYPAAWTEYHAETYCIQIMSMDTYLRLGESCLFIGIPGWFFSQPCSFTIEKAWRFIVKSGWTSTNSHVGFSVWGSMETKIWAFLDESYPFSPPKTWKDCQRFDSEIFRRCH